jgi:riboflavin kinase/FMN adenylyltransferase
MQVFNGFSAARGRVDGCAVALGNFDGVHWGHQALFSRAIAVARAHSALAIAATFAPHPGKVLAPALAPKLLTPQNRKLELLEALGLDAAVVQPFDRAYASLPADDFLARDLFGALAPRHVVVGPDFTYGRARAGTAHSLRIACEQRGVGFTRVEPVACDGVVVSSTKIRELVLEGRIEAAARLLGRPYDLAGTVIRGRGRGRRLGFPTANILVENELLPALGVYAVRVCSETEVWGGAANVGRNLTFGEEEISVEVNLFGFSGELYGAHLAIELLERLRGEQRFDSAEALSNQISADCQRAQAIVARAPPPGPLSPFAHARAAKRSGE